MRINRPLLAVVALGGFAAAALARAPVTDGAKLRDQLRAEAVAANTAGATSRGDRDPNPSNRFVSSRTRAEVRAEAIEATRLGLLSRGDQRRVATPAELELIRQAGLRARAAEDQRAGK